MNSWWFGAFSVVPYHTAPPGDKQMLTLVAYDIADLKRLARCARPREPLQLPDRAPIILWGLPKTLRYSHL